MSNIKLFRIGGGTVDKLTETTDTIEKSVQILFEKNLEALLGVRFLASEFATTNGGRIDTLGLDENGCPVKGTKPGRRRVEHAIEARILELTSSGNGILKIGRRLGIGTA
jgi:hypothetical protein